MCLDCAIIAPHPDNSSGNDLKLSCKSCVSLYPVEEDDNNLPPTLKNQKNLSFEVDSKTKFPEGKLLL